MKPEAFITKQLKQQKINFKILQQHYDPSASSLVKRTVNKWTEKFIGNKSAPSLDNYLWHIFSFEVTNHKEGNDAVKELNKQWTADTLIFNEPQQYLIRCTGKIPILIMDDFTDDIYLCHHNMKWTFVIPHEYPDLGPYFSTGN